MKYVYFLRTGNEYYKIGISNNVKLRLKAIQTSSPQLVQLVAMRLVEHAEQVESELHSYIREYRSSGGTEWFKLTNEQALDICIRLNTQPHVPISKSSISAEIFFATMEDERASRNQAMSEILDIFRELSGKQADAPLPTPEQIISSSVPVENLLGEPAGMTDYENQALKIFKSEQKASASLLQRKLGIGYAKAARIVDSLEDKGFVGPMTKTPGGRVLNSIAKPSFDSIFK